MAKQSFGSIHSSTSHPKTPHTHSSQKLEEGEGIFPHIGHISLQDAPLGIFYPIGPLSYAFLSSYHILLGSNILKSTRIR